MGEGFGLGDGSNDLSGVTGLARSKASDAQRRATGPVDTGRWPAVGTVVRVLALALGAIVVLGWLLTALNG